MRIIIFILLLITYFLPFVWGQIMIMKVKKSLDEGESYPKLIDQFNKMTLIPIINILLIRGFYKGLDVFNEKKH